MEQKPNIDIEALKKGGVIKLKGKDMFSIWVKTYCCNLSSRQLDKVADVADKYARSLVLFTTRQIPIIPFIKLQDVEAVKKELESVNVELDRCGPRVRNINVCYDSNICPDAVLNPLSLGEKLEKYFYDPILHKIKIGISGCEKDCIICQVLNDIGFVAHEKNGSKTYDAYFGGKLGLKPFIGVKIALNLTEDECIRVVQNYFDLLKKEGRKGERAADIIRRLGKERVQEELNSKLDTKPDITGLTCKTKLENNQKNGKIILKIRATCGEVTTEQVRKISEIAKNYGKGFIHFTVRGDPEIPCVNETDIDRIKTELKEVNMQILEGDKGIDNIQTCFGDYCDHSACDTQSLLRRIDKRITEIGLNNRNITISGAGCPNSCGIAHLNDIGILGIVEPQVDIEKCNGCGICVKACKKDAIKVIKVVNKIAIIDKEKCSYCGECIRACPIDAIFEKRKGFAVLVGGKGEGGEAKLAQVIAEFLTEEEAFQLTDKILEIIKKEDKRVYEIIDHVGLNKFKEMVGIQS
jgi:dissimilatory sulfite reductase (desulfoviridin) alpha/beta subunit